MWSPLALLTVLRTMRLVALTMLSFSLQMELLTTALSIHAIGFMLSPARTHDSLNFVIRSCALRAPGTTQRRFAQSSAIWLSIFPILHVPLEGTPA